MKQITKKQVIIAITLIVVILAGYVIYLYTPKKLDAVFDLKVTPNTKLDILYPNESGKIVTVTDKDTINKIFSILKQATITRQFRLFRGQGYAYSLHKLENDKEIFSISIIGDGIRADALYKADRDIYKDIAPILEQVLSEAATKEKK